MVRRHKQKVAYLKEVESGEINNGDDEIHQEPNANDIQPNDQKRMV